MLLLLLLPLQGERNSREEVAKVFALFDPDVHGRITFRELKRVITELGESISEEEMHEMIEEADRDHDGEGWWQRHDDGARGAVCWCGVALLPALVRICHAVDSVRVYGFIAMVSLALALAFAGYVTFEDFFRIMKKKSDNPLDDLDDDDDY